MHASAGRRVLGRRSVPSDLLRNIELLVGVALPLFLTGVWLQDHLTGLGRWAHPLESAFFEWLSLVPLLAFLGFLHTVGLAVVVAVWPRAANRFTVVLVAVLLVPLLLLAGRPLSRLTAYAVPLVVALAVYALASRIPGGRAPPSEDLRTAPLSEEELLGHSASPSVVPTLPPRPPEVTPPAAPSQQARS
jgi:hypothetical protein